MGDFSKLKLKAPYIAMVPQWDFLNFIVKEAQKLSNFKIIMGAEAVDILKSSNNNLSKITGIKAKVDNKIININSKLVIAADGRKSTIREKTDMKLNNYGVSIDVLWFRINKLDSDPEDTTMTITNNNLMVMINRRDYWQCAYIIPKDKYENIQSDGLDIFINNLCNIKSFLSTRLDKIKSELNNWDKIKLLSVQVNRLEKWYQDGLLFIGDAAHAMSPVGGVGINLAIQDAVAAHNILSESLISNNLTIADLEKVQKRRELPTKLTQKMQLAMHKNLIYKIIDNKQDVNIPFPIKIIEKFPFLNKIPAYIIGKGFRSESII